MNRPQHPTIIRLMAILLVVVMALCAYPLPIIAEGITEEKDTTQEETAFVVTEDETKRSMFDKHTSNDRIIENMEVIV